MNTPETHQNSDTPKQTARERLIEAVWLLREARLCAVLMAAEPNALRIEAPASLADEWVERVSPHRESLRLIIDARSETGRTDDQRFGDWLSDVMANLVADGVPRFVAVADHDRELRAIDCRQVRERSAIESEWIG